MEKTHGMTWALIMGQFHQMKMGILSCDVILIQSIVNSNRRKLDGKDLGNTRKIICFQLLLGLSIRIFAIRIKIRAIVKCRTFY